MTSRKRTDHRFKIADFTINISFEESAVNNISLLSSFGIFAISEVGTTEDAPLLSSLLVDDNLKPAHECELIKKESTGNGDTIVYLLPNGGYQYIISDTKQRICCMLQTDRDFHECQCALNGNYGMRAFGLNNALMLIFAFAGSRHGALLIHASCVGHGGMAYPFIAMSGTGKSTHTGLWMSHIDGTELLNDDNPVIRVIDNKVFVYGSPWSGKTPCYRNVRMPLGAITKIERAPINSIEKLRPIKAFASLLPACSSMNWDKTIYNHICNILTKIVEIVPIYTMHCLPNEQAARLCHKTITTHEQ